MPDYDVECRKCGHASEQTHMMREAHFPCPKCKSKDVFTVLQPTAIRPPLDGSWEYENGGRGRYFSQLEDSVDCKPSAHNHFRSRNEAIEACKKRGFQIIDR